MRAEGGTCGVGAGDVGGEVYRGCQSAHVDAKSRLDWPSGIVQRVESGCDEPRGDAHERVDEEIDAAQLERVSEVDETATQQRLNLVWLGRARPVVGKTEMAYPVKSVITFTTNLAKMEIGHPSPGTQ